jgi:hypothetical protein
VVAVNLGRWRIPASFFVENRLLDKPWKDPGAVTVNGAKGEDFHFNSIGNCKSLKFKFMYELTLEMTHVKTMDVFTPPAPL